MNEEQQAPDSTSNVSGGIDVNNQGDVSIGKDVIGRDKIESGTNVNSSNQNVTNVGSSSLAYVAIVAVVVVIAAIAIVVFALQRAPVSSPEQSASTVTPMPTLTPQSTAVATLSSANTVVPSPSAPVDSSTPISNTKEHLILVDVRHQSDIYPDAIYNMLHGAKFDGYKFIKSEKSDEFSADRLQAYDALIIDFARYSVLW